MFQILDHTPFPPVLCFGEKNGGFLPPRAPHPSPPPLLLSHPEIDFPLQSHSSPLFLLPPYFFSCCRFFFTPTPLWAGSPLDSCFCVGFLFPSRAGLSFGIIVTLHPTPTLQFPPVLPSNCVFTRGCLVGNRAFFFFVIRLY